MGDKMGDKIVLCRWDMSDDIVGHRNIKYCGKPIEKGAKLPYCPDHLKKLPYWPE